MVYLHSAEQRKEIELTAYSETEHDVPPIRNRVQVVQRLCLGSATLKPQFRPHVHATITFYMLLLKPKSRV